MPKEPGYAGSLIEPYLHDFITMLDKLFALIEFPFVMWSQARGFRAQATKPHRDRENALGVILSTNKPFSLSSSDLAKHCYILGATGCGKTTFILNLIEEDIKCKHATVILDMRGDLVNGALRLCEKLDVDPSRITLLDLREKTKIQGFNPLAGAGEPYIRALHLLEVLSNEAESWGVQLEETLRSALLLLAHAGKPLPSLELVFFDETFRLNCLGYCTDETVVRFWERYGELSQEKQHVWAVPVLNKVTSLLAVPTLRHILTAEADMNLGSLLAKKGHILLVSLAVDELHRSARIMGSLLVSAIEREMMARVNIPETSRNPVRLYVDEFENMACSAFESLIAEGRRFKLSLVLSHQTLSQLDKKLRSVIRNNVGLQLLFQLGFEDMKSLERELPDDLEEEVSLRSLNTGEAIVMWRSGESYLVKFRAPNASQPSTTAEQYRARILSHLPPPPGSWASRSEERILAKADSSIFDLEDLL